MTRPVPRSSSCRGACSSPRPRWLRSTAGMTPPLWRETCSTGGRPMARAQARVAPLLLCAGKSATHLGRAGTAHRPRRLCPWRHRAAGRMLSPGRGQHAADAIGLGGGEGTFLGWGIDPGSPSAHSSPWTRRFGAYETAFASGWMRVRGTRRRRGVDRGEELPLSRWLEERLLPLRGLDAMEQRQAVCRWWQALARRQLFVLNKLLTGEFARRRLRRRSWCGPLAQAAGLPPATMAHRLMGDWSPPPRSSASCSPRTPMDDDGARGPIRSASPRRWSRMPSRWASATDWLAEWKWDGIRAQLVRRGGAVYLWSRGEELITERFPEIAAAARAAARGHRARRRDPGLPRRRSAALRRAADAHRAPEADARRSSPRRPPRSWRTTCSRQDGAGHPRACRSPSGARGWTRCSRRPARFLRVAAGSTRRRGTRSPATRARVAERATSRASCSSASPRRTHAAGERGDWWKWKIDPYTIDAVLIYAQPGHGRRATLFTDYTFAVWHGERARARRQGVLGLVGRGDRRARPLDPPAHHRAVRPGARGGAGAGLRAGLRGHRPFAPGTRRGLPCASRASPAGARTRRPREADTLERVKALLQAPREPPSSS